MAMKANSTTSNIPCVTINRYDNSVTVVSRRVGYSSLAGVYTKIGDFVTPNPHTYTSIKSRGLMGNITTATTKMSGSTPYVFNWESYVTSWDTNVYNKALAKYYDGVRGSVDVSIDLIQWRKTLQMVNVYKRMIRFVAHSAKKFIPWTERYDVLEARRRRVKRGSRRHRQLTSEIENVVDAMARARLEFVYAWSPTVKTLQALANGALTSKPGLIRVDGRSSGREERTEKQFSINAKVPIVFKIVKSTRVSLTGYYNPAQSTLDNLTRITSVNPVSILYEAMPFSFVLDWMWNFSGFLRSYETAFTHRNDFVKGHQTVLCRHTVEAKMAGFDAPMRTDFNLSGAAVHQTFARSLLGSNPTPYRPRFELDLGVDRVLNALALAKVLLPRVDSLLQGKRR